MTVAELSARMERSELIEWAEMYGIWHRAEQSAGGASNDRQGGG